MKSLIWILNSALALLFLVTIGYILFSSKEIKKIPSIEKSSVETSSTRKEEFRVKDSNLIYEKDLFGTYVSKPSELPQQQAAVIDPSIMRVPEPPSEKPIVVAQPTPVQFLPPLEVTFKGYLPSFDGGQGKVILADNNTTMEGVYEVGDKVLDAHIVAIFKNRVILLRSNGQQETLYCNTADARDEVKSVQQSSWAGLAQELGENKYAIDPDAFVEKIHSLAQFIDMLDLTTVFSKGTSIGCRVGRMDEHSVGTFIGLLPADIIISINGIEPKSTTNRVAIYNGITNLPLGGRIVVELVRQKAKIVLEYTLQPLGKKARMSGKKTFDPALLVNPQNETEFRAQTTRMVEEQHQTAPALMDAKKRDRQAMMHYGSKKSILSAVTT